MVAGVVDKEEEGKKGSEKGENGRGKGFIKGEKNSFSQ